MVRLCSLPGPICLFGEPGWCVLHLSRASACDLKFIGSISGPVTMKWPLAIRIVRVVT